MHSPINEFFILFYLNSKQNHFSVIVEHRHMYLLTKWQKLLVFIFRSQNTTFSSYKGCFTSFILYLQKLVLFLPFACWQLLNFPHKERDDAITKLFNKIPPLWVSVFPSELSTTRQKQHHYHQTSNITTKMNKNFLYTYNKQKLSKN